MNEKRSARETRKKKSKTAATTETMIRWKQIVQIYAKHPIQMMFQRLSM